MNFYMMLSQFCMIFILLVCSFFVISDGGYSRKKRFVAFPEGSTFLATLCPTMATITGFGIYFEGVNWGVAYTLPNRSSVDNYISKYKKTRRERRDVYMRIETIIDDMGFDGRACIQRALCEAPRKFKQKSKTLSEDLLRILLRFPLQSLSDDEPEQHQLYHSAYRKGKWGDQQDCAYLYPQCSFSLIDIALGNYDT